MITIKELYKKYEHAHVVYHFQRLNDTDCKVRVTDAVSGEERGMYVLTLE